MTRNVALRLQVVGLDVDRRALVRARRGAYDETICADITEFRGREDADVVVCQSVLEHVLDMDRAIAGVASLLRPGECALVFAPCRLSHASTCCTPTASSSGLCSRFTPKPARAKDFARTTIDAPLATLR